jgi:hypothetical protein
MIGNSEPWPRLAEIASRIADSNANECRHHAGRSAIDQHKALVLNLYAHDHSIAIMPETSFPLGAASAALVPLAE